MAKKTISNKYFTVYDNFLTEKLHEDLYDYLTQDEEFKPILNQHNGWNERTYWHPHDGVVLKGKYCSKDMSMMLEGPLKEVADKMFAGTHKRYGWNFSTFAYPAGAGFDWHDDGNALRAVVYYANLNWNSSWGGELLVRYKDGIGGIIEPKPNRLVVLEQGVKHKITPVSFRAGDRVRYSVAGFVTR